MANSEFPEDMSLEIFSRLPSKSVGQCRCLSETWRNLLSTPYFLESHFTRKPHQQNLILITPSHYIATVNDTVYRILDLPICNCLFAGSCGGLVLLTNSRYDKFLLNPVTLERVKLPLHLTRGFHVITTGVGYDRLSKDYKVVTLSAYITLDLDCSCTVVDVYSVNLGVCIRRLCPYNHLSFSRIHGAFVNGALHWKAFVHQPSYRSMIAAFNLADMVFADIPLPSGLNVQHSSLVVLGGCLCVIDNSNIPTDIWIMKEYRVPYSWTKLCVVGDHDWERITPLCYIWDEGIVLLTEDKETGEGSLVVYKLKETQLWDWFVDGVPVTCSDAGAFVESLVSPAPGRRV